MGGHWRSEKPEKLYVRLPVRIKDETVVRDLHPNIIAVHLPRQKSRRWCIVDFENKQKLKEAVSALQKIKIKEKSIKLLPYKKGQHTKNKKQSGAQDSLVKLLKRVPKHISLVAANSPRDMGLHFLGNPYGQGTEDADLDINGDEEWVTPPNVMVFAVNRTNMLLIPSEEESDDSDWADDNDEDGIPEDEYFPDVENIVSVEDNSDDLDYSTDDLENYPQQEEMEDLMSLSPNSDYFPHEYQDDDDSDEDYDELEYVTYQANDTSKPATDQDTEAASASKENSDTD